MDGAGDTVGKGKELPTNIDMAGAGVIVVVETFDALVITDDGAGVGTRVVNCSGAVGEKVWTCSSRDGSFRLIGGSIQCRYGR
jgi:hypothetical protein